MRNIIQKKAHTSRCQFEINDIPLINGYLYDVQGEAKGDWVDCGIGPYEFWGMKGTYSKWGIEEFNIELDWIQETGDDGETKEVTNTIDMHIKNIIVDWIYENKDEYIVDLLEEDTGEEDEP